MRLMLLVVNVVQVLVAGHDEREQTLNQLLVELDGFGENEGHHYDSAQTVLIILDPALLRRIVLMVTNSSWSSRCEGREAILHVHV